MKKGVWSGAGYGLIELLVTMAVMIVILSLTVQTVVQFQRSYRAQTRLIDVQYNARSAMDIMVRLIRNSAQINPDPDADGTLTSILVEGDWNPRNDSFLDAYETVTLSTDGAVMFKQEPGDAEPVPLADHVASLAFTYFDTNGMALADPVTDATQIALVRVVLVTTATPDAPAVTLTTSATVRSRE